MTTTTQAADAQTTVSGYAFQLLGFIPVDPKDLRKQTEIPGILLDISEGKRPISDIMPFLKEVEIRQQFTRKRVSMKTKREYDAPASDASEVVTGDEQPAADAAEANEKAEADDGQVKAAPEGRRSRAA